MVKTISQRTSENLKCVQFVVNMQRVRNGKNSELARSHKQEIYRKPLVNLSIKSTPELQTSTPHLKCLQQIFTVIKTVMQIVLENGNRTTSTPNTSARTTSKTKRVILKNNFPFIKSIIDQGREFSLSDITNIINQDDDDDLKNNEIKGFLIEEYGDSISERKNQKLFAFSSSIEVQDVINFL